MDRTGARSAVAVREPGIGELPFLELTSGYVRRGLHRLPKQGDRRPWRMARGYIGDRQSIRHGRIEDGVLAFDRVPGDEGESAVQTTAATS